MNVIWSFELEQIWASYDDGRRIQTWTAPPSLSGLVDVLNTSPALSALLLPGWLGGADADANESALRPADMLA